VKNDPAYVGKVPVVFFDGAGTHRGFHNQIHPVSETPAFKKRQDRPDSVHGFPPFFFFFRSCFVDSRDGSSLALNFNCFFFEKVRW